MLALSFLSFVFIMKNIIDPVNKFELLLIIYIQDIIKQGKKWKFIIVLCQFVGLSLQITWRTIKLSSNGNFEPFTYGLYFIQDT